MAALPWTTMRTRRSTACAWIVTIGTPYYSTMSFGFHGESVPVDSRYNVSFGPTTLARLEGVAAPVR